jgi:2-beta-glucuronyltransferase
MSIGYTAETKLVGDPQVIEQHSPITNALFISVHDFRSLRKASVHFIAGEMARRGQTRFFSVGLSRLSERRGDTRSSLADRANRVETIDGVDCYLWKTPWHPFNLRRQALALAEAAAFSAYRRMIPRIPLEWIREADIVFVESGMAAVFVADVRRINPSARIVYLASDDLDVIGCAATIKRDFVRNFDMIDTVRLPSRYLLPGMPHGATSILVPHGIDRSIAARRYPNPYGGRPSGISVGSMLFDASFFTMAARAFPGIDFHIIGAGKAASGLQAANIVVHPEMAFAATLPYLQHAAFGVAPYLDADTPRYLIDTSLKLRQFGLFGIPAVCPTFALGDTPGRFGYTPGDEASIIAAIEQATQNRETITVDALAWSDVVDRILRPASFADTRL